MITPSKVLPFEKTVLAKLHYVLRHSPQPISLSTLLQSECGHFESIDEFMLAIDVLYVLGRINIDRTTKALVYVD